MLNETETSVLRAAIRLNAMIMALAFGLLGGAILWLSTVILLLRGGEKVGVHLSLLSVFFPGYSVTWAGAWIGLLWGFLFGALSGAILYWSFARALRARFSDQSRDSPASGPIAPATLLISGNALGTSLGALLALQLLVTTNSLVVRGTASFSSNAALLAHYLPGYSVSFWGSIVGAVQLFAAAFVVSHILAGIYNFVARLRMR